MNVQKLLRDEVSGWKTWEKTWFILATISVFILSLLSNNNLLSLITAVTGVISIICSGKGKLAGFVFGAINATLYAYIAFTSMYYGEMLLNLFYFLPMEFYGFYVWSKHMNPETKEVNKKSLSNRNRIIVIIAVILGGLVYGFILQNFNDAMPFVDSLLSILSIITMFLAIEMYMENWILWICVNLLRILLWVYSTMNGLNNIPMVLMSSVYLINSIMMFVKWKREVDSNMLNS